MTTTLSGGTRLRGRVAGAGRAQPTFVPAIPATVSFYVSPSGSDSNPGTQSAPFATLTKARDASRAVLPVMQPVICLREGTHRITTPLALTSSDNGHATWAPTTWKGCPGEVPVVSGSVVLSGWSVVTSDNALWSRIPLSARGHVYQCTLADSGVTDYGTALTRGVHLDNIAALELIYKGVRMPMASWPSPTAWSTASAASEDLPASDGHGGYAYPAWDVAPYPTANTTTGLTVASTVPSGWAADTSRWVHQQVNAWADMRVNIRKIVAGTDISHIETVSAFANTDAANAYLNYLAVGGRFRIEHVLEAVTVGTWYLDSATGILYFWPPAALAAGDCEVTVADNLVTVTSASDVTISGITFDGCRGNAISATGGARVTIDACTIRNAGNDGIVVVGGASHTVTGCAVYGGGRNGIKISGGTQASLAPAYHIVCNNDIHDTGQVVYTTSAGIYVYGPSVGITVNNNRIHDVPQMGILFLGNYLVIEKNELYNVMMYTGDGAAIYAGGSVTQRGNAVRYNYIRNVATDYLIAHDYNGMYGIYLDGRYSQTTVLGNIITDVVAPSAGRNPSAAFLVNGGRDNTFQNNIMVRCPYAVWVNQYGTPSSSDFSNPNSLIMLEMTACDYTNPPYSTAYPLLPGLLADTPTDALNNAVVSNVMWLTPWYYVGDWDVSKVTVTNNLTTNPSFVVPGATPTLLDYRLQATSPMYDKGWVAIDVTTIGLVGHVPVGGVAPSGP